jgi:hypothetical protein
MLTPSRWSEPPTPSNLKIFRTGQPSVMAKLTGTRHGDAADHLLAFYQDKAHELEQSGQYFMAAIALGFALETAVLTYLLVAFGEENGGELEIPDSVNMSELIAAANAIDVLTAPVDIPSHIGSDDDDKACRKGCR